MPTLKETTMHLRCRFNPLLPNGNISSRSAKILILI